MPYYGFMVNLPLPIQKNKQVKIFINYVHGMGMFKDKHITYHNATHKLLWVYLLL